MKSLICSLLVTLTLVSCGNPSEDLNSQQEIARDSTAVFGNVNFNFPKLSSNASELVADWPIFEDFQKEATSINGLTLNELRIKTPRLLAHTDSLSKKIPDSLNTRPISSRLVIVKTRSQLLDQIVKRSLVDTAQLQIAIKEMNISVQNFLTQLNGKLQKDAIDLQRRENEVKELEKQRKYLDSILQSEIEDNREN